MFINIFLLLLLSVYNIVCFKRTDFSAQVAGFYLALILLTTCLDLIGTRNNSYKQGQIDAINGEIHYREAHYTDGTTGWKYIKEEEE